MNNQMVQMKNVVYMKSSIVTPFYNKVTCEHISTGDGKFAVYVDRQLMGEVFLEKLDLDGFELEHVIVEDC